MSWLKRRKIRKTKKQGLLGESLGYTEEELENYVDRDLTGSLILQLRKRIHDPAYESDKEDYRVKVMQLQVLLQTDSPQRAAGK